MRFLRLFSAIVAGVVIAAAQQPKPAADSDFTLQIDARNVSVNVGVIDATGRPVTKLTKDDFLIYEDGVLQDIQTFESVDIPYNILILVDCSGSTEADWPLMGSAVDRFAARLRDQDKISVSQFGGRSLTLLDWRRKTGSSLGVKIQQNEKSCEQTDFYGALEDTIGRFKGVSGRKGVVVLTDGVQTQPAVPMKDAVVAGQRVFGGRLPDPVDDRRFQAALKTVSRTDVVFYFVAVNTDLNPDEIFNARNRSVAGRVPGTGTYNASAIYNMQQARSRMQLVAEATGGRVVFPKRPADVAPLYEEIARDLGTYYGLWYSPRKAANANDTKPRKIEVRVKTPGLQVNQERKSYIPAVSNATP